MAVKGKGSRQVRKKCVKDTAYPCKFACILKTKNCKNPLRDQAKTFVEWMELQEKRIAVVNKKRLERGRSAATLNKSGRIITEKPSKSQTLPKKENSPINSNTSKIDPQKIEQDFDTVLKEVQALYKTEEGQEQISIGGAIDRLAWLQTAVRSGKPDLIASAIPEAIKKLGNGGTAIEQKLVNTSLPYAKLQYDKLPSDAKAALAKDQLTDAYGKFSQSKYDLYALNTPIHKAIADDLLTYIKNDVKLVEQKKEKNKSLAISQSGKTMYLQKNAKSKSVTENNPTKTKKTNIRKGYSREEQANLKTAHQQNLYGIAMGLDDSRDKKRQEESDKLVKRKNLGAFSGDIENQTSKINKLKADGLSDEEANGVTAWISALYPQLNRAIYGNKSSSTTFGESAGIRAAQGLKKLPSFDYLSLVKEGEEKNLGQRSLLGKNIVSRYITIPSENLESFLRPYKEAEGKTFKEPSFFATSIYLSTNYGFGANVQYKVKTKKNGQGVAVDKYKNEAFEGEVLFPPYSQFKITRIEQKKAFDVAVEKLPSRFKGLSNHDLEKKIKEEMNSIIKAASIADELARIDDAEGAKDYIKQLDQLGFPQDFFIDPIDLVDKNKIGLTIIHMEEP